MPSWGEYKYGYPPALEDNGAVLLMFYKTNKAKNTFCIQFSLHTLFTVYSNEPKLICIVAGFSPVGYETMHSWQP